MGAIISAPIAIIVSILATRPSDLVYWYKWITCYTYIQSFRRLTGRRFDVQDIYVDHDPVKTGFISAPEEIELESPLEENEIYSTADEIFFYGVNSKSECLVTRISRNTNHEAEAWIYLKLANGKLYQLRETSGYQQSCSEKKIFTCGDLQMNYVLPMRTWRIFFNGLLREVNENDTGPEKMVHVKFALLWRAASDVFDFASDVNAKALAKSMAKVTWTESTPPLEKVNKALNFYAQCGIITGTINIGDSDEEQIYLFGERLRFLGDSSVTENRNFSCNLGYCVKDGNYIHLSKVSIANVVEDLEYGFIVDPVGKMFVVSDATIEFDNIAHEVEIKNDAVIRVHADDNSYDITTSLLNEPVHLKSKESWNGNLSLGFLRFEINFKKGFGILIDGKNVSPVERKALKYPIYKTPTEIPLCVHFTDSVCQDSSITGGKGSSLGKLTELSKELKNFSVPPGMVVTTAAYDLFQTNKVYKKMNVLLDILYGDIQGDLQEACERVMQEVIYSDITNAIRNAIESCLQHSFPDRNAVKFAVRSSATGEDTEQMSAAGQMETFLGVTGDRAILTAVKKCWASKFRNIAVQYKKQYGQIINTPMAVVIQEMVPCDVAGVLFTCDPLTGNPSVMSITANYGLGESVVSASEEPDTIELERDVDDNVTIKKKIIGAKRQRIILQSGKGTSVEEVSEKEREACCLSDEMILRLASLAIKIEKSYRSHRDIEWGFWKNNLYIFQSRPVTSGTNETDFEIEHEADGPMRIEKEYFSVCNVGEVMPGAMSPLGLDIILNVFRLTFQRAVGTDFQSSFKPKYFLKGISCMYNRVMFYLVDIFEQIGHDDNFSQSALINFFGRAVEDEELSEIVKERYGKRKSRFFTQKMLLKAIANVWTNEKALKKGLENFADYRIPVEKYKTSEEMFNCLLRECSELTETMGCHMLNSDVSSLYNSFVIGILTKARGELNADVYNDFARLLMTSSEVESADVPASIDRLACYITKEINPEEFKKKDTKEIIEWLEKSKTDAGKHFREFLKKHGHRCLKEFDVRTKTYGMDPTTLIQSVKNLVGSAAKNPKDKREEDLDKIFAELGLSLGLKNRTMLKFLIPRSRKGVQNREASKSLVIKSLHAWRKGYYHLAKLMVREGRIPDEDILFFMNLDEIRELINTRSPKIISRAHHRRRHFPIMDKHMFPEIMKGFPKPINIEDAIVSRDDENFSMKGIPVSQGVAKAFVRVALTLEEAAHLKPGEILVTYSTDIGWSPYFPILAGVVTEIGGLISHGAVVSREYGLPCIAGLHGATMQFQTGAFVLLDGYKGILKRLTKPDNLESTT